MNDEVKGSDCRGTSPPFRRHLFYPHFLKDRLQESQEVISKFVEQASVSYKKTLLMNFSQFLCEVS